MICKFNYHDAIILDGRYYLILEVNISDNSDRRILRNIFTNSIVREDVQYINKYGKMADQETIKLYRLLHG